MFPIGEDDIEPTSSPRVGTSSHDRMVRARNLQFGNSVHDPPLSAGRRLVCSWWLRFGVGGGVLIVVSKGPGSLLCSCEVLDGLQLSDLRGLLVGGCGEVVVDLLQAGLLFGEPLVG
jgi:hypothetical protein